MDKMKCIIKIVKNLSPKYINAQRIYEQRVKIPDLEASYDQIYQVYINATESGSYPELRECWFYYIFKDHGKYTQQSPLKGEELGNAIIERMKEVSSLTLLEGNHLNICLVRYYVDIYMHASEMEHKRESEEYNYNTLFPFLIEYNEKCPTFHKSLLFAHLNFRVQNILSSIELVYLKIRFDKFQQRYIIFGQNWHITCNEQNNLNYFNNLIC